MGRTPKRDSMPEEAVRYQMFLARADQIAAHPLTVAFKNRAAPDMAIDFSTPAPKFDLRHAPEDSWVRLATLVRPVMFLQGEPIQLEGILNLMSASYPAGAAAIRSVKAQLSGWRTHHFFGIKVFPSEEGSTAPSGGNYTLTEVHAGPPNTWPAGVDPHDEVPMLWDWELAEIYYNGELFHSNADQAARLARSGDVELASFRKAAELRTIRSTPFIGHVAGMLRAGQAQGVLPSLPGSAA